MVTPAVWHTLGDAIDAFRCALTMGLEGRVVLERADELAAAASAALQAHSQTRAPERDAPTRASHEAGPARVRVVTTLGDQSAVASVDRRDKDATAEDAFVLVLEFADHGPIEVHMTEASALAICETFYEGFVAARRVREADAWGAEYGSLYIEDGVVKWSSRGVTTVLDDGRPAPEPALCPECGGHALPPPAEELSYRRRIGL